MSYFILPPFSPNTPNKIGIGIDVSGKNTLIKTENDNDWRAAIADEPINAKIDGKKIFCVRVDNAGRFSSMMFGFTPMETFDSNTNIAYFGCNGFTGAGMNSWSGNLYYPVDKYHNIIDRMISIIAKEIIVILTISNSGKKKEIRFLCDGKQSKSTDVSEHLNGDFLFPIICFYEKNQQVTTIALDQIKTRTPAVERLLFEGNNNSVVESQKENKKEKKVKQVATKKTKKETKAKTTKATKKKEETKNKKEKKPKAKK
jgi:hypothetical protein